MSDANRRYSGASTERSAQAEAASARGSENLEAAYYSSPIGPGFRAQLQHARGLTRAGGLRKAVRVAIAASMLLAGRGPGATS